MDKQRSQQFMLKVVGDVATSMASALVLVGDRTGLFKTMRGAGSMSAQVLGERTGIPLRYVEEWLSAMSCAGYVEHDSEHDTFSLPDEHAQFLTDPQTEYYLGGMFQSLPGLMSMAPRLSEAFERGEGISFAEFGAEMPVALEQMNRSVYRSRLVRSWLPTMPEVVRRLEQGGRTIDVGCGTGVVPITIAQAFPNARVEGLDLDARSIEIARGYAREAGLDDRVRFTCGPAELLEREAGYDLITTFDVVHDLPDPQGVLEHIAAALAPGGSYLMVEPKVEDRLEANIDNPFGRMLYAISCLHCVPQSLAQGGPGIGACWGPARARLLAHRAGFTHFAVLPARSPVMAFYELRV